MPPLSEKWRGRIPECNLELGDKIAQLIRGGTPKTTAAAHLGVRTPTLMLWLANGRSVQESLDIGQEPTVARPELYLEFLMLIERAEASAKVLMGGYVATAAPKDWRAAMTWLEKRDPEHWKEPDKLELSGPGGAPIQLDVRALFVQAMEKLAGRIVDTAAKVDDTPAT